eukprot:3294305-Prymnesium_polylepis.2
MLWAHSLHWIRARLCSQVLSKADECIRDKGGAVARCGGGGGGDVRGRRARATCEGNVRRCRGDT